MKVRKTPAPTPVVAPPTHSGAIVETLPVPGPQASMDAAGPAYATLDAVSREFGEGEGAESPRLALVIAVTDGTDIKSHPDADRAAAFYEAHGFEVQMVKDPDNLSLEAWLAFGLQGVGEGGSAAIYFAGRTDHQGAVMPGLNDHGVDWDYTVVDYASFYDALGMAFRAGASASLVIDGWTPQEAGGGREGALDAKLAAQQRGEGASTGSSASAGANDDRSTTQRLLELAAKAPDVPLDQLMALAVDGDANRGGRVTLGEASAGTGTRRALVIGNSAYVSRASLLPGAARDASGMAGVLGGRGYEVDFHRNLTGQEMHDAFEEASAGLADGDELLLYYAGHGDGTGLLGTDGVEMAAGQAQAARDAAIGHGASATLLVDACYSDGLHRDQGDDVKRPEVRAGAAAQAGRTEAIESASLLAMRVPKAGTSLRRSRELPLNGDPHRHHRAARALSGIAELSELLDAASQHDLPSYRTPDLSRELPARTALLNLLGSANSLAEARKGRGFDVPTLEGVGRAIRQAEVHFDLDGRELLDRLAAVVGGDLDARDRIIRPESGDQQIGDLLGEAQAAWADEVDAGEADTLTEMEASVGEFLELKMDLMNGGRG